MSDSGSVRKIFQKVSSSPTRPPAEKKLSRFDVADVYEGPAATEGAASGESGLDEKLRQAYFWIVNHAIISPFYDIEYNDEPPTTFQIGDRKTTLSLPTAQSYSSFVLMPLLNLAVRRRCLFVGGPGRGKTASAILMGVLAGYSLTEIRRAIQHGQPEMTVTDLLGNPIPSDLMNASSMDEVRISWRKWLGMRVKIIDEYNRIPTRTQSALLTVLADNYAEVLDQIYECPEAAWYLTANDDAGGGTYKVIEALQDRIDIVVHALHFNTRFIGDLLLRIEAGISPEKMVPESIIFSEEELNQMNQEILAVTIPPELMRRVEFFASHFEFFESAGEQLEYKTKDNVKLAGMELSQLMLEETGRDLVKDLGSQTKNGLSVRAIMTCLVFAKAIAYFRGESSVSFEDFRQMLPFVLHDKLAQNPDSPFFEGGNHSIYRVDRVGWIRRLFDLSSAEFDRLGLDKEDPVASLRAKFDQGLDGLSEKETRVRLSEIERTLQEITKSRKVYGHVFDDLLKLKYLHQRYTNYLNWLLWTNKA
ncbi:MAG: ATPase [Spirochaetaceae bacterium]|nr:ATPase [Spirochaetaceae bacterium]|tara:strand:+ start:101615 stop:103213 length:1599 start_codon:yes stop_codon:yes gene_type:complete